MIIPVSIMLTLGGCSPASTRSAPAAAVSSVFTTTSAATGTDATVPASDIPDVPLTMAKLPSQGYIDLSPSNEDALEKLGLAGSTPSREPANLPYDENGLFWSNQLLLNEGDVVRITVHSQSPVSWFGVDWSDLAVRGVLAMTDVDEDGWNFVAEYPEHSSIDAASGTMRLAYQIPESGDYQVLVKNSNSSTSYRLTLTASLLSQGTPVQSTENDDD